MDSGMYYMLYSAMGSTLGQATPKIPLIIFLQGGPGFSSLFSALA